AAELSVLDHARKHVQSAAAQWCCRAPAARPGQAEVLGLVEAVATDNLVRRGRFLVGVQGSPQSAVHFLNAIESAYKDHPGLAAVRAQAEIALSRQSSGTEKDG